MLISEIMSDKGRDAITVSVDTSLTDVCATLAQHRIGAVVVSNGSGGVSGILSERDIVRAISETGTAALAAKAAAHMTHEVETCSRSDQVLSVLSRMTDGRFRHMPVVEAGKLLGVVSIGDLVKARIAIAEQDAEDMRNYILAS